jgi:hypothetical protein
MVIPGAQDKATIDNYKSGEITIQDGLDQGDPFSTTGMIFYIDKLIQNGPDQQDREDAIGFADDVCVRNYYFDIQCD